MLTLDAAAEDAGASGTLTPDRRDLEASNRSNAAPCASRSTCLPYSCLSHKAIDSCRLWPSGLCVLINSGECHVGRDPTKLRSWALFACLQADYALRNWQKDTRSCGLCRVCSNREKWLLYYYLVNKTVRPYLAHSLVFVLGNRRRAQKRRAKSKTPQTRIARRWKEDSNLEEVDSGKSEEES